MRPLGRRRFVAKAVDPDADDLDDDDDELDDDQKDARKIAAVLLALRTSLLLRVSSATTLGEARRRIRLITGDRYGAALETALTDAVERVTAKNRKLIGYDGALLQAHVAIVQAVIADFVEQLAQNDRMAARAAINGAKPANLRARLDGVIAAISSFNDDGKRTATINADAAVRAIVTTALHSAANRILLDAYSDADVQYVRWVCESDPCELCAPGDDVVYPIGTPCPGIGLEAPVVHMNCRCSIVPATKAEL